MLRRPEIDPSLHLPLRVAGARIAAEPRADPVATRRSGLVRALEETVAERRSQTIASRVQERLEQPSQALAGEPQASPGSLVARWVGYDESEDCQPLGRLPLAGLLVRFALGDQVGASQTTGPAGLVRFEVPEGARGSYLLEVTSASGAVIASAEGELEPEVGAAQLVEVGRSRELEPAFARGRNLMLAASRAETQSAQIGAKVERALARQEDLLRQEIASLDAMLTTQENQDKGDTDGPDAPDQERRR